MKIFCQTNEKYKYQKLGNSQLTLYDYGCYLFSLVNGLNKLFGWRFTPESFSDLLRAKNLFLESNPAYINVDKVTILEDVFTGYDYTEPVGGSNKLRKYGEGAVVLGRVSAIYIGGTGSHFVLVLTKTATPRTVTVVDPWDGKEKQFGINRIKGIRVYKCKRYGGTDTAEVEALKEKVAKLSKEKGETIQKWMKVSKDVEATKEEKKELEEKVSDMTERFNNAKGEVNALKKETAVTNTDVEHVSNFVSVLVKFFVNLFVKLFKLKR